MFTRHKFGALSYHCFGNLQNKSILGKNGKIEWNYIHTFLIITDILTICHSCATLELLLCQFCSTLSNILIGHSDRQDSNWHQMLKWMEWIGTVSWNSLTSNKHIQIHTEKHLQSNK